MSDRKMDYLPIHGQVAQIAVDERDGQRKIVRFLRRQERLKIVSNANCVRPQQLMRQREEGER